MTDLSEILQNATYPVPLGDFPESCHEELERFVFIVVCFFGIFSRQTLPESARDYQIFVGPRFGIFSRSWVWTFFGAGPVLEIFLSPGPSWSGISKSLLVLVRSGRKTRNELLGRFWSLDPC